MSSGGAELDGPRLEALYRRLEKPVYNVVYRWLWDPEESQDVVQEAFERLWKMRARVRLETVTPLLYRIALNLAGKRRRRRKVLTFLGLSEVAEPIDAHAESGETALRRAQTRRQVREAVEALPEKLRRVIMLTELTDLTYQEVGDTLGIPAGTVGSRRHAALARLRDSLPELQEGLHHA